MASDDEDVPETGAVFTFGKTRFADNLASKFWIRDDPVVHASCGDEHSAIVTAKGKLYTFGSNNWGQLGHGNNKAYNKPSVVKKLKPEKVYLVACGRNHTLVATESGKLYSFGCGSDGQLGHGDSEDSLEPKAIESFDENRFSKLACGSDFSTAVTENGILYTWGSGSEGQNGLGEDAEAPQRLYISGKVMAVACGYYHMAVVTDDGSLFTCGEKEGGKLGLEQPQLDDTSQLQKVESIKEKVLTVSCGAEFTIAVTQNGHVYSFGQGNQGQLGLGSLQTECESPEKIQTFVKIKAKNVECGESFTAIVTKHGNLYTFGDGRHGKLGLGDECFSNLFKPEKVIRFNKFVVTKISCGGCHMLVTALHREESTGDSDSEEQTEKETTTSKQGLMLDAVDGPRDLSASWSARDKRRQKNIDVISNNMSHTLPPVNKSSLPRLNGALKRTLPTLKTTSSSGDDEKKPVNPLNMSRLPQITYPDEEEDQSTPKSKSSPRPLPRGLPKPSPVAPPRALPRVKKEKEESEEESEEDDEEEEEEDENSRKQKDIKDNIQKVEVKQDTKKQDKKDDVSKQNDEDENDDDEEDDSEEESEDEEEDTNPKKTTKDQNQPLKPATKTVDEHDSGEGSEEDDDDDEEDDNEEDEEEGKDENKNEKKPKVNEKDKKEIKTKDEKIEEVSSKETGSKSDEQEEEEEEEDKEDDATSKKKDSKQDEKEKKNKKNKDKSKEDGTKDKSKNTEEAKEKKGKKGKNKKKDTDEDDKEDTGKDIENKDSEKGDEINENEKSKDDKSKDNKDKKESEKNTKDKKDATSEASTKQKDKKSGICAIL